MSTTVLPVPEESAIFLDRLITELSVPDDVSSLKSLINFEGTNEPFLPIPHKSQVAASALQGLLGLASLRFLQLRSAEPPTVTINTDHATLFMASPGLIRFEGHNTLSPEFGKYLPNLNEEPLTILRLEATNVYKTKDEKYFHLHGSLAPSLTLKALGVDPDHPVKDSKEARALIAAECAKHTAEELRVLYVSKGLCGDIVLKPEEYDATPQGKIINSLPLARFATVGSQEIIPRPLPSLSGPSAKPLEGIRVVELTRVIAGSVAGRLLAELGATVVRVISPSLPDFGIFQPDYNLGKRPVHIDLRTPAGQKQIHHLLETADIFLQGYRPGAMERLGLSHAHLAGIGEARGKPLVIIDEACYGGEIEKGPWSTRPGYQQIADVLTGIAWETGLACGKDSPIVPCLPISDYCTGILCAVMAVLGLVKVASAGERTGTIVAPVALCAVDLWIRKQGRYPDEWVRATYDAAYDFTYETSFVEMLLRTLQTQFTTHPEYNQPTFYAVTKSAFDGTKDIQGAPRSDDDFKGPPLTHLAPVIRFDGIDTNYTSTAPWGFYRPGWSEEDAEVLAKTVDN